MSRSAGCRAGWAGGWLADAIRLAGQVAAVGRFAMIVGWRRASAYDPATERGKRGMGSGVWALIVTGLAAGQATAGAAVSDGRCNAGNGAVGPSAIARTPTA
jgi:hypothetical protein